MSTHRTTGTVSFDVIGHDPAYEPGAPNGARIAITLAEGDISDWRVIVGQCLTDDRSVAVAAAILGRVRLAGWAVDGDAVGLVERYRRMSGGRIPEGFARRWAEHVARKSEGDGE